MNIVLIITIAAFVFLSAERFIISYRVRNIRVRIHVNGTRGKSSVARYIGAALSASPMNTFVKITGVIPTLYSPDGTSRNVKRRGKARVQEQVSIISQAFKHRADALVLECMSLKPEYQQLESRIFLPHVTVITNIQDDHREELGISHEEHVQALAASIPYHSVVFTVEMKNLEFIQRCADERGTVVHIVPSLNPEVSAQVPEGMFPANVSIALAVASHFGVDERRAFNAITNLELQRECIETTMNGFSTRFYNGFAVNDVPSAQRYIDQWCSTNSQRKKIIILNTRNDRPLRTVEFVKWCATLNDLHHCFVIGSHAPFALRSLKKRGLTDSNVSLVSASELSEKLHDIIQAEMDIFGFGNIAEDGFKIIEYFTQKDAA